LLSASEIWYDPDPVQTVVSSEVLIDMFTIEPDSIPSNQLSKWMLCFEFDKAQITDKKLLLATIAEKIEARFDKYLHYLYVDESLRI